VQDANDLLMGGGIKSAAFPDGQYGTTVAGPIVRQPQVRQQTDFDSGKPKTFDNGDPMMQIVVQVQTDLRDDQDDDGVRAFYVKAQMQQAVRDAVRQAGAKGLEVGGFLAIRYERDEPNSRGRGKPKKIYAARYTPPTAQAANDALMTGPPAEAAPPDPWAMTYAPAAPAATPAWPAQTPAAAAPLATAPAAAVQTDPPPPGVDPQLWATLPPAQRQAYLAAAATNAPPI
jgi:hypothetical protein